MKKIMLTGLFLLLSNALWAANVSVLIENIRNDNGRIMLRVYNTAQSWEDRKEAFQTFKNVAIKDNRARISLPLEKGVYVLSAFHDENHNGEADMDEHNHPMEGRGYSRNYRGLPDFDQASFKVGDTDTEQKIYVLYPHQVTFIIQGIRNTSGKLIIGIYNNEFAFLKDDMAVSGSRGIAIGGDQVKVQFRVLAGKYAAIVIHDENSNDDLDRFLGIPKEGYAYSRNAKGLFGPPKFREAAFYVGQDITQEISIIY